MDIIRESFNQTLSDWNTTDINITIGPEIVMNLGPQGQNRTESPGTGDPRGGGGRMAPPGQVNLPNSMILAFTFPVALSATVLNVFLLIALHRTKNANLKAKNFIQNNAIANILFPISVSLDASFMGNAIGGLKPNVMQCLIGVHFRIIKSLIMVQAASVLTLPLDRLYATLFPLHYRTVGYHRAIKILMLAFPWFAASLAAVIFLFLVDVDKELEKAGNRYIVCILLDISSKLFVGSRFLDSFTMTCNFLSFFIYVTIFIVIKYQFTRFNSLSETYDKRRVNLSLSVTYFIVNLTTLALYLPLPLYVLIINSAQITVVKICHLIYTLNSCVDPLLLMKRIPVIKDNLPFSKNRMIGRQQNTTECQSIKDTVSIDPHISLNEMD